MGHLPDIVPESVVRAAMAEPALRGRVFLCSTRREALVCEGEIVGFVCPHETKTGWRHGPIFVLPAYRRRKLVEAYYAAHPERTCVAFVADDNAASRGMHKRAGFVDWRRGPRGWFMRREALGGADGTSKEGGPKVRRVSAPGAKPKLKRG